jgi:plasmid maintenance system antidote protein VapI
MMGYSDAMICRILNGQKRPSLKMAIKMEKATGISVEIWAFAKPGRLRKEFDKWAATN